MTARKEDMGKEKIRSVEQMAVYQARLELALEVEKATRDCGPDFRWLRVQVLRSSESVCANMAEGFYSQYSTEYLQALYRCRREARETMTHLQYAMTTQVIPAETAASIQSRYEEALRQLANLMASIDRKIQERGKGKPGTLLKESNARYATEQNDDMAD
jgi:four helix bundle protein